MTLSTSPSDSDIHIAAQLSREVYGIKPDWLVMVDPMRATTWLAIEGSDDLVDWRRNFEFLMTSSDTHAGFANYATLIMAELLAAGVVLNPKHRVIICGHSLGGAVATIIAAHLQDHLPHLCLVTFGSPKPGGKRFAQRLRVRHHRYVHGHDVVPLLPSRLLGFKHTTSASLLQHPRDNALMGIADHAMDGYLMALPGVGINE